LAFVHDEGLDDLKATGLDPAIHLPIPTLRPFNPPTLLLVHYLILSNNINHVIKCYT